MMNKLGLALVGGVAAVSIASIVLADEMAGGSMSDNHMMTSAGKKVTLTGEVRDISCYTTAGLKGMKHVACAKSCVLNGQELGIQTPDGNIVMVLGKGPNDAPNKALLPYVESKVTVTGTQFQGRGFSGIQIGTVAAAK
jgi:hypothetical protein